MREPLSVTEFVRQLAAMGGAYQVFRADDLAAIPLRELLVRNPRLDAEVSMM